MKWDRGKYQRTAAYLALIAGLLMFLMTLGAEIHTRVFIVILTVFVGIVLIGEMLYGMESRVERRFSDMEMKLEEIEEHIRDLKDV